MKSFLFLTFFLSSIYHTHEPTKNCKFKESNLNFSSPKSDKIANTFWQESKEEEETVKRLYITYKDGSTAIIKHRFCSSYKFEAAYYMEEKDRPRSTEKIESTLKLLLSYVAHKDSTQKEALKKMLNELNKYSFDPSEMIGADQWA